MVALALFLVQILVTMFRYYTRLAAFYDALADALVLVSRKVDWMEPQSANALQDLVSALSPDRYDFRKPPRSPADQAANIAKDFLANIKK